MEPTAVAQTVQPKRLRFPYRHIRRYCRHNISVGPETPRTPSGPQPLFVRKTLFIT